MITFVIFALILPVHAYAATDLLSGIPVTVYNSTSITNPTGATDGNDTTSTGLSEANHTSQVVLTSSSSVASIRIKVNDYTTMGVAPIRLVSGSTILKTITPTSNDFITSFTAVSGVTAIWIATGNVGSTPLQVYSIEAYAGAYTPPMTTPSGLTVTPGNKQNTLNWSAITDSSLSSYRVYQNGTLLATVNKPSTTYTVTGLTNGTSYSYQISWVDAASPVNESSKSTAVTGTPVAPPDTTAPTIPSGVTASDMGNGVANIQWNISTDPDDTVAGYNLFQNGTKVNTTGLISGTSASVSGLIVGQTYNYTVSAVDTAGNESAKSSLASVTIASTLTANFVPNMNSIVIQVTGGKSPYTANWGTGSGSFSSSTYTISGLTANTDYTITLTDSNGQSVNKTVNTGNLQAFVPPTMPDPVSTFQMMIDSFGTAGTIALAVIGAAVALGVIVILGLFGWRLTKKWLSAAK